MQDITAFRTVIPTQVGVLELIYGLGLDDEGFQYGNVRAILPVLGSELTVVNYMVIVLETPPIVVLVGVRVGVTVIVAGLKFYKTTLETVLVVPDEVIEQETVDTDVVEKGFTKFLTVTTKDVIDEEVTETVAAAELVLILQAVIDIKLLV